MRNITKFTHFDNRGSLESGIIAENRFDRIARYKGYIVMRSTKEQDMIDHFDRVIYKDCIGPKRVEIKGLKRITFQDKFQDKYTWIELHGINEKDQGWLYGRADIIAFERTNHFLLVDRHELINLINNIVNFNVRVENPEDALYKVYNRKERPYERSTLIELSTIEEIKMEDWEKLDRDTSAGWL